MSARGPKKDDEARVAGMIIEAVDTIKTDMGSMRGDMKTVSQDISLIKTTQAAQQAILDEHIRRTELAEQAIVASEDRIKPLEAHVLKWSWAGKLIIVGVPLIAAAITVIKLIASQF